MTEAKSQHRPDLQPSANQVEHSELGSRRTKAWGDEAVSDEAEAAELRDSLARHAARIAEQAIEIDRLRGGLQPGEESPADRRRRLQRALHGTRSQLATDPKLSDALDRARGVSMTPAEAHAQRRSWVIGQMGMTHPGDDPRAARGTRRRVDPPGTGRSDKIRRLGFVIA